MAAEVAEKLECPLDVLRVAKVGMPGQEELAIGAVSEGGHVVRNEDLLAQVGLSHSDFEALAETARGRIGEDWREGHPFHNPAGKTAVLCDDGIATGATARVAIDVLRSMGAGAVWLAAPVAPAGFDCTADRILLMSRPRRFVAVGKWYENFDQITGWEVRSLLRRARLR